MPSIHSDDFLKGVLSNDFGESQKSTVPSSLPDDTMRLFLSYASEDFEAVSALYDRLEALGLRPWMDKRDLLPGQRWRDVIAQQVRQCDLALVCLSPQSVDKRGFYQREIRAALDAWQEKRQDDIYLIPVRLAVCDVPQELAEFNWVDLYDTDGWTFLLRAIEAAAKGLGRPIPIALAEALASRKQQPPPSPAAAPADDRVTTNTGARSRLQTEYGELQRQYDNLTSRIARLDTDLARELDSERKLTLEDRRAELTNRRIEVSAHMAEIEMQLEQREQGQQGGSQRPSQDVAATQARYVALEQDEISEDSIAVLHYNTSSNNSAEMRYISGNEPLTDIKVKMSYTENIPGIIVTEFDPGTAGDHKEIEIQDFYSLDDKLVGLTILNPGDGVRFYVPGRHEVVDGEIEISVSFVGARSGRTITARKVLQQDVDKRWLIW